MPSTYLIHNSAMAAAAAPVAQPTGTAIRTMMQIVPAASVTSRVIAWGCSFDGSAAATPGKVELVEVNVAATMSTAYVAGDIQPHNTVTALANTAGASGVPFNLSTTTSGFATAAVTEGTVTVTRMGDIQQVAPTNQYLQQFPLGYGFDLNPGKFLRVRATFAVTVNMIAWVIIEV